MNRWLLRTLNLFAALFGMMVFFPAIVISVQLTHLTLANWSPDAPQIQLGQAWWAFGLMIGISLIARLITWMLDDLLDLKPIVRRITTIVLALLAALGTRYPASWIFEETVICVVMMIFGFFAFWNGSSLYFRTYHQVLALRGFIVTAAVNGCIIAFMFGNQCNPFGSVPYALILLAGLLMMVIGMNQGGIDTMMNMRRHRLDQLPPKIRIYNFKLTGLMTGIMFLSVLFYQPLEAIVRFTGIMLREGFGQLLIFLFSYQPDESVSYDYSVPEDPGDPPVPPPSGMEPGERHPLWDVVLYGLLITFAILFILSLPKIIRAVVLMVRELSKRLKEALHTKTKPEKFASEEYIDIDETVESIPETTTTEKQQKPSAVWRNWRQQYRKYTVMAPGTDRIREGYRLLKEWLIFQEVPLQDSDTTLEIAHTTDFTLDFSDLNPATHQYNMVRYGGLSYDLCDPGELDQLLGRMAQTRVAPKLSRLARARKEEALR